MAPRGGGCDRIVGSAIAAGNLRGAADRLGFVLLSIDKNLDAVRQHVAEHGYDRAVVFVDPERRLMTALGVVGTPTTMLVDPAGGPVTIGCRKSINAPKGCVYGCLDCRLTDNGQHTAIGLVYPAIDAMQ